MLGRSEGGIPYLRPHAVLLFKAKDPRPKDEFDLAGSLPKLANELIAPFACAMMICRTALLPGVSAWQSSVNRPSRSGTAVAVVAL